MGRVMNSNFSASALKRSRMLDKDRAYSDKLKEHGKSGYSPASLNKPVMSGLTSNNRILFRQLADSMEPSRGEWYDRIGVETEFELDPETGALKQVSEVPRQIKLTGRQVPSQYLAGYLKEIGSDLKEFMRMPWQSRAKIIREVREEMLSDWQHMIADKTEDFPEISTMPSKWRGYGRDIAKKYNPLQKYTDQEEAEFAAYDKNHSDAGQTEGLSQKALDSKREYEEYKKKKALEAENKDEEPDADTKMGYTPSDANCKDVQGQVPFLSKRMDEIALQALAKKPEDRDGLDNEYIKMYEKAKSEREADEKASKAEALTHSDGYGSTDVSSIAGVIGSKPGKSWAEMLAEANKNGGVDNAWKKKDFGRKQ